MSTAASFLMAALAVVAAPCPDARSDPAAAQFCQFAGHERLAQAAGEPGQRVAVEVVILRIGTVDAEPLKRALSARTPGIELYTFGSPEAPSATGDPPGRRVFVDIVARTEGYSMTFILGDGRAYQRDVLGGAGDVRELASAIANTLAAIEDAALVPEPERVPLPEHPEAAVAKPPKPQSAPPSKQPEPLKPAHELDPRPEPKKEPPKKPPKKSPKKPVKKDMSIRSPLELGLGLAPAAAILLAPGDLQGASGYGGSLYGTLRFPRGLGLNLGVRTLALRRDDLWLLRTRVGIATGYIHRDDHLELAGLAGFSVEPWGLREFGARVPVGARPLLGGFASLALGYRVQPREGLALRVGGRLELSGSALSSGRIPEIRHANKPATRLALGGFELSLAFDLTIWVSLKKSRSM